MEKEKTTINEKNIFETIDSLFEESPKEAEKYMVSVLEEAKKENNNGIALQLCNELIGYYRQTSEKEKLLEIINETHKTLSDMGDSESLNFATSMLNIANAYRSIGELEAAKEYYDKTQEIYDIAIRENRLDKDDMCIAGLYNNMSLLYQEEAKYDLAHSLLKRALQIVTDRDEKFEIAVTYANLANTMLLAKDYDSSYKYAKEAVRRFKARGYLDAHYCAALSAMGMCFYEWGQINKARTMFVQAADIVEKTIGRNSQYDRLKESIDMCEKNNQYKAHISGMELSKEYYEEYGRPMLEEAFKPYVDRLTIGLVGEGSECYGFDDEFSADHDFGPSFCIFVDDDIYEKIGHELESAYESLPEEYMGYACSKTAMGANRRGVIKTSEFYKNHLCAESYENIDFSQVKDYELAVCSNGQLFNDSDTSFTEFRNKLLKGYPEKYRLLKLAEDVANVSQTGQYNFERMIKRNDDFTAQIMVGDFCKAAMTLYHHMQNVYVPHDKWLKQSTLRLAGGEELIILLEKIIGKVNFSEYGDVIATVEEVGSFFATKLYELGDISDVDPYLANHVQELLFKSSIIDYSKEELVDKIARLEFTAFDKVKNEGGRASCQNDWPTFSVMRKSQYLTWNKEMLVQYMYDFTREYEIGHNLITEKYGRMMESTAPEKYEEIKDYFPVLSEQKKAVIEQIVGLQMSMTDEFGKEYPNLAGNARSFYSYEDNLFNTSYETYLRGEISTYSDKMLQLYAGYVIDCVKNDINIAKETITNTAILYGYNSIDEFEAKNNY